MRNVVPMLAALIVHVSATASASAQDSATDAPVCTVNLRSPGTMKDIVSNVLLQGAKQPEAEVRNFLAQAENRYATGQDLMTAAARHFRIDEADMAAKVESFRHINCSHDTPGAGAIELSAFARDVAIHVILHELGHALVREFDLPILSNEEAMADAFATHYLTVHMPDRALEVLLARTTSLMIEARQVPRDRWTVSGEHENDARRAFQIAALAIAADAVKYAPLAEVVGMDEDDISDAKDYGSEIHRSWRRLLAPLLMPAGQPSQEARVTVADGSLSETSAAELIPVLESAISSFDWHSQVSISFVQGEGGASWSRGRRTITVHTQYLRRFIDQGRTVAESGRTPQR